MRSAPDLLIQYARYHRDRRNIATHFLGIPLIVLALGMLLSQPMGLEPWPALSPAMVLLALVSLWYLRRRPWVLTLSTLGLMAATVALAGWLCMGRPWVAWIGGTIVFAVGWLLQFLGHYYEGKKPAFVDDLVGLLVGPMFVMAEALFIKGWNPALREAIEAQAGPLMIRALGGQKSANKRACPQ